MLLNGDSNITDYLASNMCDHLHTPAALLPRTDTLCHRTGSSDGGGGQIPFGATGLCGKEKNPTLQGRLFHSLVAVLF